MGRNTRHLLERSLAIEIMENSRFKKIVRSTLSEYGFKQISNQMVYENDSIFLVVSSQKSNFGNYFYIPYGVFVKNNTNKDRKLKVPTADFRARLLRLDDYETFKDMFDLDSFEEEQLEEIINRNVENYLSIIINDGLKKFIDIYPEYRCMCRINLN